MKYVIFIDADCLLGRVNLKIYSTSLILMHRSRSSFMEPAGFRYNLFLCYIVSAHGLEEWGT